MGRACVRARFCHMGNLKRIPSRRASSRLNSISLPSASCSDPKSRLLYYIDQKMINAHEPSNKSKGALAACVDDNAPDTRAPQSS